MCVCVVAAYTGNGSCGLIFGCGFKSRENFFIIEFNVRGVFFSPKNFAKLIRCSENMFIFQCEEEMRYEMLIDHIKW